MTGLQLQVVSVTPCAAASLATVSHVPSKRPWTVSPKRNTIPTIRAATPPINSPYSTDEAPQVEAEAAIEFEPMADAEPVAASEPVAEGDAAEADPAIVHASRRY